MAVQEYKAVYRGAETSSPAFNAIVRKSARLIIPQWEPDWTPEGVLDRIYELHRRGIGSPRSLTSFRDLGNLHAVYDITIS